VALPLAVALVMGPVVTVLATVGPGVLGAAWTALGAVLLTGVAGRVAAGVGLLAVAIGVLTSPVTAVPLALGLILLLVGGRTTRGQARPRPRHAGPDVDRPDRWRWLLVAAVLPVAGLATYLATTPDDLPVDSSVRTVLVLPALVVVGVALRNRSLRPPATVAGAAVVLAALPWPGAGSALAGAVAAVALLAALLLHAGQSAPAEQRSHPLVRAAVAVPVLVLVAVGALFLPATAPKLPTAHLAAWINGPSSGRGTVAVPASMWGQLVRDGVPAGRVTPEGSALAGTAAWTVGLAGGDAGDRSVATFGSGRTTLTVQPSATSVQRRRDDDRRLAAAEQRAEDERRAQAESQATRGVLGGVLAGSGAVQAPAAVLSQVRDGGLDERALALLEDLTSQGHRMSVAGLGSAVSPAAPEGVAVEVTVSAIDGRPATAAALTRLLQDRPEALRPAQVTPGPSGITLSWPVHTPVSVTGP
jgi:putative peptide zinc metalloprotease protein